MDNLSLKELKAQNAASANDKEEEIIDKPKVDDETLQSDEQEQAVNGGSDSGGTEEEQTEIESWMQAEDAETSGNEQSGFVPDAGWAAKRKAKKLQATVQEKEDENAELKARIAALESGNKTEVKKEVLPPRPTREQFDYDDDAYDQAVDEWNDKKLELKLSERFETNQQKHQQKAEQEAQHQATEQSLNAHYERAAALVESGKVSEEAYRNADRMVRLSLDQLQRGQGDNIANALISTLNTLGEGSEKVMYHLGVNPAKMQELQVLLTKKDGGLAASAFLGNLQAKMQTPTQRRSQAPKPGARVDGEGGNGGKAGTLHKQWSKSTDPQERVSLKRKARAAGVDVSKW